MLDNPSIFGFVYTQLTNIEQEQNGLYYYDRKPKFDTAKLKEIFGAPSAFETQQPLPATVKTQVQWNVLIGSMHDSGLAKPWRYTEGAPASNWTAMDFSDIPWKEAPAPFGLKGDKWKNRIRTHWSSNDLWLRRHVAYDGAPFTLAYLVMHHDDDVEIYVNGTKVFNVSGWNDNYEAFDVSKPLASALKKGDNTIAVHVHQDKGGQYFDAALLVAQDK
jgi:hypothetical protein